MRKNLAFIAFGVAALNISGGSVAHADTEIFNSMTKEGRIFYDLLLDFEEYLEEINDFTSHQTSTNWTRETPVEYAESFFKKDQLRDLVVQGFDIHEAIFLNNRKMILAFIKDAKRLHGYSFGWDAHNLQGDTPAIIAVKTNNLPVFRLLKRNDADIHMPDELYGRNPAHWAALNGHTKMLRYMNRINMDFTIGDNQGRNVLHLAMLNLTPSGQKNVKMLIRTKKFDLEAPDHNGDTALLIGAKLGMAPLMEPLIKANANIEARNNQGMTPLLAAVFHGNIAGAMMLIEAGADMNALDNNGLGIFELAEKGNNPEGMKKFLEEYQEKLAGIKLEKLGSSQISSNIKVDIPFNNEKRAGLSSTNIPTLS